MKPQILAQGAEATITLITNSNYKIPSLKPKKFSSKKIHSLTIPKKSDEQSEEQIVRSTRGGRVGDNEKLILKTRQKKSYRIPELDDKIRKLRTRNEAKIMEKAEKIILVPKILKVDEKTKKITMQFIDGKRLSQHLDKFPLAKQKQILKQIGESIAKLHHSGIAHGDLTTSNMIYVEEKKDRKKVGNKIKITKNVKPNIKNFSSLINNSRRGNLSASEISEQSISSDSEQFFQIFFIDFGLAFQNAKYEDKAVDIHLLKQALEAKHFTHWKELYKEFENAYKKQNKTDAEKVLNQLNKVEKRGRYRH